MSLLLIFVAAVLVMGLSLIAFLSHHKKSGLPNLQLIGASGVANSVLNPEGTVLINGEIWRACASDGATIEVAARVQVLGSRDHLLTVTKIP